MRRFLALSLVLAAAPLRASCGLEFCAGPAAGKAWESDVSVRSTRFKWAGLEGHYNELTARSLRRWEDWAAGLAVPVVNLHEGGTSNTGLGNPVVYGERIFSRKGGGTSSAGLQAELPLGNSGMGIAAEHGELLPYALYSRLSPIPWSARAGFRASLNDSHAHAPEPGERPLVVHPHEEKEFLYRLTADVPGESAWIEGFIDGIHAFGADVEGPGFLTGGLSLRWGDFRATFEQALTRPRRIENSFGISFLSRI